jgi:large subunit ribosomal protein L25
LDFIELKALTRTETGNGPARRLRMAGQIPAVFYGPGTAPVLLSVNTNDFDQALKKSKAGQLILNLIIQNSETDTKSAMVMIKELQVHPVSRNFQHVDFYEIAMDRKVKVKVPVVTTGKPKGVELGGVLQIIRRELEILCLPLKVPESIEIDITDLDMGDAIHIEDISLEGDIEFLDDTNITIVTMLSPKIEEEPVEEEEEIEEDVAEEKEEAPETGEKE